MLPIIYEIFKYANKKKLLKCIKTGFVGCLFEKDSMEIVIATLNIYHRQKKQLWFL